jgi:DNA-directed RNA polymerase specialized sigma24 family protein
LAGLAPYDEVAALCVVMCLRPELIWMCRQLGAGSLEPEDADSEVVAVAWEVVTRDPPSGGTSPDHTTLVNVIWTGVRRSAGLRRRQLDVVRLPDDLDAAGLDPDPSERWPGLLATALAHGVLTPRQVVLIAQTRMEQRPLCDVATTLGRPYDAARKERQRGEAALREFARAHLAGDQE